MALGSGNNSQTELQALVLRYKDAVARGRKGGLASAQAYREAGAALRALKKLPPHGQFGRVAAEQCDCSKQWRSRLMALDRDSADVEAAWSWAESRGRQLGAKAYSVDGALSLVRQWRRVQCGAARTAQCSPAANRRRQSYLRENAMLRDRLSAAKAMIAVLEEQVDASQSPAADPCQQDVDDQTRLKLEKAAGLWLRGGTDGERLSFADKLFGIARNLGWSLSAPLQAVSIEGPADWTFAPNDHSTTCGDFPTPISPERLKGMGPQQFAEFDV